MDSYLAVVPRGLQTVATRLIREDLEPFRVEIHIVGENNACGEKWIKDCQERIHQKHGRRFGTINLGQGNGDVSVGYHTVTNNNNKDWKEELQWSVSGLWEGSVWVNFCTNAPPKTVSKIRGLGPLLATVSVWETTNDNASDASKKTVEFLQDVNRRDKDKYSKAFAQAEQLWRTTRQQVWDNNDDHNNNSNDKNMGDDKDDNNTDTIRFRMSCVRAQPSSKKKKESLCYSRQAMVEALVDGLVPRPEWKVDLTSYDVEVVLLSIMTTTTVAAATCPTLFMAVGLTLRPYQRLGAKSFHSNTWPPDIGHPYLPRSVTKGVTRLRPSNAQLLWKMANLEPGDIVLDPCAGIGTIPLLVATTTASTSGASVVSLGGDLCLGSHSPLMAVGTEYVQAIGRSRTKSGLLAWDATILPLRSSFVDAVVSDLPFGQQCLSSAKIHALLPPLLRELARVVCPTTGRMVLLCGAFSPVLEALQRAPPNTWELPCRSVLPVNIGGLLAWVLVVQRGSAPHQHHHHKHRRVVQKMTAKRQHAWKQQQQQKAAAEGGPTPKKKFRRLQR